MDPHTPDQPAEASSVMPHADDTNPTPGPYAQHAPRYHSAGWAPLPLPARAKKHPPDGYTGHHGTWPSYADVHAWTEERPTGNIALRLPPNVIGIDVDNYDAKPGGLMLAQLETTLGPLPATWRSTSRDDGISGIRLFTVPEGLRWPSILGAGIEVIRHGHRYTVAWPSIHPDTGNTYRWITPDGATALADIPTPETLPELPHAWIAHFTGGELATDQARAGLTGTAAHAWLAARAGHPCRRVQTVLAEALTTLPGAGSRHDHMLTATNRLIWIAGLGHPGVPTALDQARAAFLAATGTDRAAGEAEAEWDRMVTGAIDLAAAAHPASPPPDPCEELNLLIPRKDQPCPTPTTPGPAPTTSTCSTPAPTASAAESSTTTTANSPVTAAQDAATSTVDAPAPASTDAATTEAPSWGRVDLGPYLDGTYTPPVPTLMPRADGVCLLYPGKTHSFHGESESGKSLVLQIQAANLISRDRPVLYVDFEDDAGSVTRRLLDFGATPDQIRAHFDYRKPEVKPTSTPEELNAWLAMLRESYDLAVIDGVTDSLGVFGYSTKDNDDISAWMRAVPRNIADQTGAAVVVIDHVTKNAETRGRFALGGQAKMAAITGSAFMVEISKPLGIGLRGTIVLRVAKDRGGYIRSRSGPMRAGDRSQEAAQVIVDSTGPRPVVTIEPPRQAAAPSGAVAPTRMTGVMEKISKTLEAADGALSGRGLQKLVGGNKDRFAAGLRTLVEEGYVTASTGAQGSNMHESKRPYRQREDPLSDLYGGDLRGLIPAASSADDRPQPSPDAASSVNEGGSSHDLLSLAVSGPEQGNPNRPPLSPTVPRPSPGDSQRDCPPSPAPFRGDGDRHHHPGPVSDPQPHIVQRAIGGQLVHVNLDTGEILDDQEGA